MNSSNLNPFIRKSSVSFETFVLVHCKQYTKLETKTSAHESVLNGLPYN